MQAELISIAKKIDVLFKLCNQQESSKACCCIADMSWCKILFIKSSLQQAKVKESFK